MNDETSLTARLHGFMQGDRSMVDRLLHEIMPKLHEIAHRELKRERYQPLSKTELIHEVWLRSLDKGGWQINDRGHFYALASLAMRRVLLDFARNRLTQKRGGEPTLSLQIYGETLTTSASEARQIVEIGLLMEQLECVDAAAAIVVDMHYFAGFTLEEVAENTDLSFWQARACWERGREWLRKKLNGNKKSSPFSSKTSPANSARE